MIHPTHPRRAARRTRARLVVLALLVLGACVHNQSADMDMDEESEREPVHVHVRNENFADVNIYVVSSGVARRLGQVSGNSVGDFTVAYNVANGQPIAVRAIPIGGNVPYTSQNLSVGGGQVVDVRLAASLRQSSTVVHDP
jgi:hypothetical protein